MGRPVTALAIARRRTGSWIPPLVVFVAVLLLWEQVFLFLDVKTFLIPRPTVIWSALLDQWPTTLSHLLIREIGPLIFEACGKRRIENACHFRDGLPGFIISALNSYYVFLKFAKLWEMQKRAKSEGSSLKSHV